MCLVKDHETNTYQHNPTVNHETGIVLGGKSPHFRSLKWAYACCVFGCKFTYTFCTFYVYFKTFSLEAEFEHYPGYKTRRIPNIKFWPHIENKLN